MGNLSDFMGGSFQLTAGAAIVQDASGRYPLIEMGPDGKGYPVQTSDYAAVANSGAQIVAQTQIVGQSSADQYQYGTQALRGTDGSIYTLTTSSTNQGNILNRYNAAGTLLAQAKPDTTTSQIHYHNLFFLSNGNIGCVFQSGSPNYTTFAVYDTNLKQIVAPMMLSNTSSGLPVHAVPLSGGGVAVAWSGATPGTPGLRFKIVNNDGTVALAETVLVATSQTYYPRLAQLSNGNIVLSYNAASTGFWFGIYSAAGVQVLAPTQVSTFTAVNTIPMLTVLSSGYFALGYCTATNTAAVGVYNNAGALQGSTYSNSSVGNPTLSYYPITLLNDGTQFWLLYIAAGAFYMVSIPTSGGGNAASYNPITSGAAGQQLAAFFDQSGQFLCVVSGNNGAASACIMWAMNMSNLNVAMTAPANFGTAPTTYGSLSPTVIAGGDFAFIAVYDYQSGVATNFYVGKYANTSIEGVAVSTASKGGQGSVQPNRIGGGSSAYGVSTINGTSPKSFDHSAASIPGNKGVMLPNGAILKGM